MPKSIIDLWNESGARLIARGPGPGQGETVSPKTAKGKRATLSVHGKVMGRKPGPKPDPSHIAGARAKGYRASRRSDGWVVVPPGYFAYAITTKPYPNATRAWEAAYFLATGKWS